MIKTVSKAIFTFAFVAAMSVAALGQSDNKQKPPPPKNDKKPPPQIPVRPKNSPKNDDKDRPKRPPTFETATVLFFVKE